MVNIRKANGDLQKYNPNKLIRSLRSAGADRTTAKDISRKVNKIIYEGMTTKELFRFAFSQFKKKEPYVGLKYDLRNAIMRLGPRGYAFEKLVARILKRKGYDVQTNQHIQGRHIIHEIDVSAQKGAERIMVEAKYHNKPWIYTSIQTTLYVYARFLDVRSSFSVPMIATNTKFSHQSKAYAKGVGIKLMGWKFPKEDSIEKNIEENKLYPITMLNCINAHETQDLLRAGVILIDSLIRKSPGELAKLMKTSHVKAERVLRVSKTCLAEMNNGRNKKGLKSKGGNRVR